MADTAAHLVDHVLPAVPVRQWVLTLPFPLRSRVAFDHQLQSAILGLFLDAVFRWLRMKAQEDGVLDTRPGAVTIIQRAGGPLNFKTPTSTAWCSTVSTLVPIPAVPRSSTPPPRHPTKTSPISW